MGQFRERIHRGKSLEAVLWGIPVENQAQSSWWEVWRWFTGDEVDQTMGGHGCWTKGFVCTLSWMWATLEGFLSRGRSQTKLTHRADERGGGCHGSGTRESSGRPEVAPTGGEGFFPTAPKGWPRSMGVQRAAGVHSSVGGGLGIRRQG